MVERDGWKPRYKEAAFNTGEQGGSGVPRKPFVWTEEEKRAFRIDVAILQIENLSHVTSESPSEEERAKAEYYKFHTTITLGEVDPHRILDDSQHQVWRTQEEQQANNDMLNRGAKLAAAAYLQDDPDSQAAQVIMQQGVFAPLQAHQDFSGVVDLDIQRLLQKYYPEALADPDPGMFI